MFRQRCLEGGWGERGGRGRVSVYMHVNMFSISYVCVGGGEVKMVEDSNLLAEVEERHG